MVRDGRPASAGAVASAVPLSLGPHRHRPARISLARCVLLNAFLAPVQNYKNHQIPFPLPRNVMCHPPQRLSPRCTAREAATRREAAAQGTTRTKGVAACVLARVLRVLRVLLCALVVVRVLRVLRARVRRHVLRSWFPPTPGNPGTPPVRVLVVRVRRT